MDVAVSKKRTLGDLTVDLQPEAKRQRTVIVAATENKVGTIDPKSVSNQSTFNFFFSFNFLFFLMCVFVFGCVWRNLSLCQKKKQKTTNKGYQTNIEFKISNHDFRRS